ncbi:MAG: hypothetical protein JNL28_02860 [Planctomycetes bacterium]|nr:hypothetical protein [Planctomycetota bacterium]
MRHSQRVLALASLAYIGFAASPAFAGVLTVAPTGASYTQIQAAVNAAGPGDVIMISPGSYTAVTINGKSLTLCSRSAGSVTIFGTTTVVNLTASQRVILSGLNGFGQPTVTTGAGAGAGLVVLNNAGHVRVETCVFTGADGLGDGFSVTSGGCCWSPPEGVGRDGAYVDGNAQGVSFTACEFQGGRASDSNLAFPICYCGSSQSGGSGLLIKSSLVSLYDCILRGGRGGHNGGEGGRGGSGGVLVNGLPITAVCSSGSTFRGGKGGDGVDGISGYPGRGGNGLYLNTGTSARLLDNAFVPGLPGFSWGWGGYAGLNITGGGVVHTDTESRLVMTTDRYARAGSVVDLRLQGAPGQQMKLILSRASTFQILASWHGTMLSSPGKGSVVVPLGPIPASGVLQTRYTVPPLPTGLGATSVFVQAYRDDPILGPKLAAGSTITLLR